MTIAQKVPSNPDRRPAHDQREELKRRAEARDVERELAR